MTILAWHNEPSLKAAAMERLREHRRLDEIAQGVYWNNGKGCHLGCLSHSNNKSHEVTEKLFGLPLRVCHWLEVIFEGLPLDDSAEWVVSSSDAIPVGADLSLCHHALTAWLLDESTGIIYICNQNRKSIDMCRELHWYASQGGFVDSSVWYAARSAADGASSCVQSSSAARYAAQAAFFSADLPEPDSIYWVIDKSVESSMKTGAQTDWTLDNRSTFKKIAEKSIEIFRNAPVPSDQPTTVPEVAGDLCARNLWCPDSVVKV